MIIPDVNLLLYAADRRCLLYDKSREWWQSALRGPEQVGLCAPVVFGFVRLATNPKICGSPLTINQAFAQVDNWMEFPVALWLEPDTSHLDRVKTLLLKLGTGGNLVTDAQIAAYGQQYHATICSADLHFSRFDVKWLNPLAAR
jgi:toxin-antitoxin system PIN domain toxin